MVYRVHQPSIILTIGQTCPKKHFFADAPFLPDILVYVYIYIYYCSLTNDESIMFIFELGEACVGEILYNNLAPSWDI